MDEHLSFEDLSRRMDGELKEAELERIDRHLSSCRPCRTEFDTLAWIESLAADLPMEQPPPGFRMQLPDEERRGGVRRILGWPRSWRGGLRMVAAGAALALVSMALSASWYCRAHPGASYCPGSPRSAASNPQEGESKLAGAPQSESTLQRIGSHSTEVPFGEALERSRRPPGPLSPLATPSLRPGSATASATWSAPEREWRARATIVALASAGVPEPESAATEFAIAAQALVAPAAASVTGSTDYFPSATPTITTTATITPTLAAGGDDEPYPGPSTPEAPRTAEPTEEPYPGPQITETPAGYPGP